jgi:hypothetical protein
LAIASRFGGRANFFEVTYRMECHCSEWSHGVSTTSFGAHTYCSSYRAHLCIGRCTTGLQCWLPCPRNDFLASKEVPLSRSRGLEVLF